MGLFGDSSSSSQNIDNRRIEDNQNEGDLSGNKGEITINATGGEAFDFAEKAIDALTETTRQQFQSNAEMYQAIGRQTGEILTGGQAGIVKSMNKTFTMLAIAAAVAYAVRGAR